MSDAAFHTLKLSPALLKVVNELGYKQLTPIQAQSIPVLMAGRDLIGQSKTGSGKTAAFSIPFLEKLDAAAGKPQVIVLCPTRELCAQVGREIRKIGRYRKNLQVLIVSGGQPMGIQIDALDKGVHVVVGTPGRIIDHLKRKTIDLRQVRTVVLDEADRMLDMGFSDDIEFILDQTPKTRQTVLFSATFPDLIQNMSRKYQKNPEVIKIEGGETNVSTMQQVCYEITLQNKFETLLTILHTRKLESVLIFCNFKASVDSLVDLLENANQSVEKIHGDLEQHDRDRVMAKFRNGSVRILVATDVAARGLDVDSLDAVINYELPTQADTYVHRIGRTARAGKKGLAISFLSEKEKPKLQTIEKFLDAKIERVVFKESTLRAAHAVPQTSQEASMETLYISGGRKDKVRPGDILGALTGEAGGLAADQVGKIEIQDRFSYVAIDRKSSRIALERLRNGKIKGRKFRVELVK